jgi:hypothetical protein
MNQERKKMAHPLRRLANGLLVLAVIAALPALLWLHKDPIQFQRSYLVAFLFVLAPATGSLALLFLHRLTGGRWGEELHAVLTAAARTMIYVGFLFLPLFTSSGNVFQVVDGASSRAGLTIHEAFYFQRPFFVARALLCLVAWVWLARSITRQASSRGGSPRAGFAGFGLILYFLTMTIAAIDWGMCLRGGWTSSVYGLLLIVGQALSALPLAIVVRFALAKNGLRPEVTPAVALDLGTLVFAAVMIWGYLGFSQLLIIWSANLPEEVTWYVSRLGPGWRRLALVLIVFHFLIPFVLLLMRKVKQRGLYLAIVCILLFAARLPEVLWLIVPSFQPERLQLDWMDFSLPVSMLLLWSWPFLRELDRLQTSDSELGFRSAGVSA